MTAQMIPLLIELGTDELPVQALPGLAQAFFDGVVEGLAKRGVAVERGDAKPLYTPRRLAVLLPGVAAEQPEQRGEVLGPYLNIALDADGNPTRALQGFAQKAGVEWTALERTSDAKGERFVHRSVAPGKATAALLPEILLEAVAAMPILKPMRWGAHEYAFARPVHWLVILFGDQIVEANLFGHKADRFSRGHRFLHDFKVEIHHPDEYVSAMCSAKVLVDPEERYRKIASEVTNAAAPVRSKYPNLDILFDDVADEVNCLVEWPSAVLCSFDTDFLQVPPEALIATMKTNQKFFPIRDQERRLTEYFVGIANIQSTDIAEVQKGYERVIHPRFADAKFFFDEDLKQGLADMGAGLSQVMYQAKLGTVADKVQRVTKLAESIARNVGFDTALARRAAELSKNDLQSRLVNEFPELQGIAGRYLAAAGGEPSEVGDAIDQMWMPRFAGDAIAPSQLGRVLAVAERLDTLAGGFAAGLKPSGNKDPFALRRAALGLARTLLEGNMDLCLWPLLETANDEVHWSLMDVRASAKGEATVVARSKGVEVKGGAIFESESSSPHEVQELVDFVFERLRGYYADQGISAAQFSAVRDVEITTLPDFDARIRAVSEFAKLAEAGALAAANKRSRNILKKIEGEVPTAIDPALFDEDAERELAAAIDAAIADTDPLLAQRDYVAVLGRLARLRPAVDAFFDQVMVNADDPAIRNNRLALLKRLSDRLGTVAAIEHLST